MGKYLRATATYNDGFDNGNVASEVTEAAVSQVAVNVAPEFESAATTRTIPENTAAGRNIGTPVVATDDNDDPLTYRLEGTDAASFSIDSTGQLRTSAPLDFETQSTYNVVVRASDPAGLSATINVTINVTNVDEVVPAAVQTYDTEDPRGIITLAEALNAVEDFFDPVVSLSLSDVLDVIDAFFNR